MYFLFRPRFQLLFTGGQYTARTAACAMEVVRDWEGGTVLLYVGCGERPRCALSKTFPGVVRGICSSANYSWKCFSTERSVVEEPTVFVEDGQEFFEVLPVSNALFEDGDWRAGADPVNCRHPPQKAVSIDKAGSEVPTRCHAPPLPGRHPAGAMRGFLFVPAPRPRLRLGSRLSESP